MGRTKMIIAAILAASLLRGARLGPITKGRRLQAPSTYHDFSRTHKPRRRRLPTRIYLGGRCFRIPCCKT